MLYYTSCLAVREYGSGQQEKIWKSEKKGLTNRERFAIIYKLLGGTGVRQRAAEKILKEIEKRA